MDAMHGRVVGSASSLRAGSTSTGVHIRRAYSQGFDSMHITDAALRKRQPKKCSMREVTKEMSKSEAVVAMVRTPVNVCQFVIARMISRLDDCALL